MFSTYIVILKHKCFLILASFSPLGQWEEVTCETRPCVPGYTQAERSTSLSTCLLFTFCSSMSALTTEYMLKQGDNSIKYEILIKDFHKKIKTFKIGRQIHSRIFKIGECRFQINIYPGGNCKEDKGKVGVFLHNQSSWGVKLNFTVERKNADDSECSLHEIPCYLEHSFDAYESYGWGAFLDHGECTYHNLDEGKLKLHATITILNEEVTAQRDMTGTRAIDALSNEVDLVETKVDEVNEEVHELRADTKDIKEELRSMKRHHDNELAAIQRDMREMKLAMEANSRSAAMPRRQFECPMCTEEAKPPMRLKQCGEGHIICDTCFAKDEEARQREGRQRNQCGVCRRPITGRPTALESLLGLS